MSIGLRISDLLNKETKDLTDKELIELLEDRYREEPKPHCRICGGEMSIGSIGGGEPTEWYCSGRVSEDDRLTYKPGRSFCDEHSRQSQYSQRRHGDDQVLEAVKRWLIAKNNLWIATGDRETE